VCLISKPADVQTARLKFDSIVDGTGAGGHLRSQEIVRGPDKGPLIVAKGVSRSQRESYAITANFAHFPNDHREQFALAYQFYIEKFKSKKVASLNNIVYYRSPIAHYIVAAIRKETLLEHGVVKEDLRGDAFLSRNNTNKEALMKVAHTIADDWDIPHKAGFYDEGPDSQGNFNPSVNVFEFTKLTMAEQSIAVMPPPDKPVPHDYHRYHSHGDPASAHASQCCCMPGPCASNDFVAWKEGKVELKNVKLNGTKTSKVCCKPRSIGHCDSGIEAKYRFPVPADLGLNDFCKDTPQNKCERAVPGSMKTISSAKALFTGDSCKCLVGMRLSGRSSKCKGRKFSPGKMYGNGCSCKGIQAVMVVGDSQLSPFWPDGTGANRAFLGAAQNMWNMANFFKLTHEHPGSVENKLADKSSDRFRILKQSSNERCDRCHYQEFMRRGYEDQIENVCKPGGSACRKGGKNGPLDG